MDGAPFLIDSLVNATKYIDLFYDSGCLPYAVFSEELVRKQRLPRIDVEKRRLVLAKSEDREKAATISQMTYATIDIDGRQERVFGYIIKDLAYPIILGKPWGERNDVVYRAKGRTLRIGSKAHGIVVREKGWYETNRFASARTHAIQSAKQVTGAVFGAMTSRARKHRDNLKSIVFAVTINDINKALQEKERVTPEDIQRALPRELQHHQDAFAEDEDGELPPHRGGKDHSIELLRDDQGRDLEVPWGPLYGMSREELLVLRKTLTDLLGKGWIRASSSPGGAPVLFVRKPGGGLRFCVDYRALNKITRSDRYPLPLIRETLRNLAKARWFTKLDVRAAFHRLRIKVGDEWKTAFRTRFGLFEWLVTPFGLAGAPATFQRYINTTLQEYLDHFCSAYMDDVLIYSDGDYLDHLEKVDLVLKRLKAAGLRLDLKKCEFAVKEVKYLGFIIAAGEGVKVDPEKVAAIKSWEAPVNAKGVRSFLGFANFYREFIDSFSELSQPLIRLTKKGAPFRWEQAERESFDKLKELFIQAPVLAHWDPDKPTVLEADCSGFAMGACLSQVDGQGRLRPVAYFSRKLNPAECNYEIYDKELLAIVKAIAHWKGELKSVAEPFRVLTDHKNLRHFMTTQKLTERQVRWSLDLSEFRFILEFRAGKLAQRPDALSRRAQDMPQNADDERLKNRFAQLLKEEWLPPQVSKPEQAATIQTLLPSQVLNTEGSLETAEGDKDNPPQGNALFEEDELQMLWDRGLQEDESYREIYRAVAKQERNFPPKLALKVQISECKLDRRAALLRRDALWVPHWEPLRTALIQQTHDSHITGHPGRDSTLAILSRNFYWPEQHKDVRRFVRNCDVCGRSTIWRERKQGLLRPMPIPERFHSEISIDFMTELPADAGQPKFMMVITDRLLKSCTADAMLSMDAEACAEQFVQSHWRFHGFPKAVTSDRGSNWVGDFWTRLCNLVGMEQRLSTAFHPQTDGSTERMNQEILAYLRAFVTYAQKDWPQLLPMAMLALNNRNSSVTGLSPFFLTHGYHLEPIQQVKNEKGAPPPARRAEDFVERLFEAQEYAQAAMAFAQQRMEEQANKSRHPAVELREEDKVWLNLKNVKTPQLSKKLSWMQAKYTVNREVAPLVYELKGIPSGIHNRFHVDLLRRAATDPLPSQKQDDAQPPPAVPETEHQPAEYTIEEILRAENHRVGRGSRRMLLVKWADYAEPSWHPRAHFEDTKALDTFEAAFGDGDGVGKNTGARTGVTGNTKRTKRPATKPRTEDNPTPAQRNRRTGRSGQTAPLLGLLSRREGE